jgi:GDP-L-fucose synthase
VSQVASASRRILIAGHRGMLGSALLRRLAGTDMELVTADRAALDLRDQSATREWLCDVRPSHVIVAAARVGGILANRDQPAQFLYDNLMIAANVIEAAHRAGVAKLLFIASSAAYPRDAPQPISEAALLTGPLDPAHEPYAIAKIAGIKLCRAYREQYGCDFISAMPTNLYGPGDSFDLHTSHVLPALMRKAHEAKLAAADTMTIWGTGTPRREFLHVEDCADACLFLLENYSGAGPVNIGSGSDLAILELARLICEVVGFEGRIVTDTSKPDGTPRKLMSSERLCSMGWKPSISLREGLASTYRWYLEHVS